MPSYVAVSSEDASSRSLMRVDVRREVVEPALGGELRGPDHVGAEDVAVARLGLLALDELLALGVGRRRELEDLHREALRLCFALKRLDHSFVSPVVSLPVQ